MVFKRHIVLPALAAAVALSGCGRQPVASGVYEDTNSQTVVSFTVRDGVPSASCESPRGIWISPYTKVDANTVEIPQLHRYPIVISLSGNRDTLTMKDLDGKTYTLKLRTVPLNENVEAVPPAKTTP